MDNCDDICHIAPMLPALVLLSSEDIPEDEDLAPVEATGRSSKLSDSWYFSVLGDLNGLVMDLESWNNRVTHSHSTFI